MSKLSTIVCMGIILTTFPISRAADSCFLEQDGSVSLTFRAERAAFHFGLPQAPIRAWQEREVIRTRWFTNGVQYTQTAFLREIPANGAGTNTPRPMPVLFLNIEGENTTNQYAEAWVNLSLELDGKSVELELKDSVLWMRQATSKCSVCVLEISESGIKSSEGKELRFSGNIPPSLKGSMTLKIPLELKLGETEAETLRALDFEEELRRMLRPGILSTPMPIILQRKA